MFERASVRRASRLLAIAAWVLSPATVAPQTIVSSPVAAAGPARPLGGVIPPPTFFGPTPYLSKADSPFVTDINAGNAYLEDFECGVLGVPGVAASAGGVIGPSGITDSVDADDGAIDGSGTGGFSFFSGSGSAGIDFVFSARVLGSLPTEAGIVWTDGAGTTTFEAFDAFGASLGIIGPVSIADGSINGTTGEDNFFGVRYAGGISKIHISNSAGGIEVDHLQYGLYVVSGADLSIAKTDAPDPVALGGALTYTLNVANAGPSAACLVTVTDALPAGVSFVSASGTGWACSQASGVVTCTTRGLATGAAPAITIQVTAPNSSGTLSNTATVSSNTPDPDTTNNSSTATTTVGSGCANPAAPVLGVNPAGVDLGETATLSWNATLPAGTGSYDVLQSLGGPFAVIGNVPATSAGSFTFGYTAAAPIGPHKFRVSAVPTCDPALAAASNIVSLAVSAGRSPPPPPCPPIGTPSLQVTPGSGPPGSSYRLFWSPVAKADHYDILISSDGGQAFSALGFVYGTQFLGTIPKSAAGTLDFTVRAVALCGSVSGNSNSVEFTVLPGECQKPPAPALTLETASLSAGDTFTLTWTATLPPGFNGPAGQYRVLLSTDGASFSTLETTQSTALTGTVPQLPLGRSLFFRVRAEPDCGRGSEFFDAESATASGVITSLCGPPLAPQNLAIATAGPGDPLLPPSPIDPIAVSWSPGPGALPKQYAYHFNGDPETTTALTLTVAPPRANTDPIRLFVTAFACAALVSGPQGVFPPLDQPPLALFLTPPAADFDFSPSAPNAAADVLFTDTSSPQATSWFWLFGDGATSTEQSPRHAYAATGAYDVMLVATNGAGSSSMQKTVTVSPAASFAIRPVQSETWLDPIPGGDGRRRAVLSIGRKGVTWLRVVNREAGPAEIYLRFLDSAGRSVSERRLRMNAQADATHDLAAFGLTGDWEIELVGTGRFDAAIVAQNQSGRRVSPR